MGTIEDLPQADDALLDQIVRELGLTGAPNLPEIRHRLKAHVLAFGVARFLQDRYPTVHDDARRMTAIIEAIEQIEGALAATNPANFVPIAVAFELHSTDGRKLSDLRSELARLRDLAERFAGIPFARKQADAVLRNAVGGLMLFLENLTGSHASVQKRQSDRGIPPKLSSPEARAIGKLLRVAQPNLQTTTLVNTINGIRREAGDGPLRGFDHQLFLGGTARAF